jgi:hypothetical protein
MVNEGIDRGRLIGAADVESVAVRRRRRRVPVPQPDEIAAALARNLRDLRRARQLSLEALAGLAGGQPGDAAPDGHDPKSRDFSQRLGTPPVRYAFRWRAALRMSTIEAACEMVPCNGTQCASDRPPLFVS